MKAVAYDDAGQQYHFSYEAICEDGEAIGCLVQWWAKIHGDPAITIVHVDIDPPTAILPYLGEANWVDLFDMPQLPQRMKRGVQ